MNVRSICRWLTAFAFTLIATTVGAEALSGPRSTGTSGSETAGAPEIRFATETKNLGDIVQGQTGETLFEFFNDGGVPLRILEVKSS